MQQTQISTMPQQLKILTYNHKSFPTPCIDYISIIYNNTLYIIECYSSQPEKQQRMFICSEQNNQWKMYAIQPSKNKSTSNFMRIGCARVLVGSNLYCFGGKDSKGKLDNRLVCLNLDKKQWRNQFQFSTNLVPESRAFAYMGSYQQKYLILFGGTFFTLDSETSNYIYVFDIQKSCWHQISNLAPPVFSMSVFCMQDDKIYILCNKQNQGGFLTYLYEIKIQYNPENEKLPLNFQKVENLLQKNTQPMLVPLSGYILMSYKNQTLLLFEIMNKNFNMRQITRLWVYDILTRQWTLTKLQLQTQPIQILRTEDSQFFMLYDTKRYQYIQKFTLFHTQIIKQLNVIRYKQWKKCQICYQALINNNFLMQPAFKVTDQLLQCITQKINFPFAALGLLADNALNHLSSYINYHYFMYKQDPILIVEDDVRANYSNQELEQVIVNFTAQTNYNFSSVQKRIRNVLTKQFLKRQFGVNIKVAAMRLGSQMLYISLTPNYEARVAYFTKQRDQYVCYYYAFDQKTNKVFQQYSPATKFYVQSKYGDLINQALHINPGSLKYAPYKNTTYIIGLKSVINDTGKQFLELTPSHTHENRDIICISTNPTVYKNYLQYGCKIDEAIDVSLSQYLSRLYIKNEHMKISIQVYQNQKRYIKKSQLIDYNDKNLLIKPVTALDTTLKNYDLKSIQLMFNNKINRKLGIFHNGVLIYHRNRLIKRFGCQLGDLLHCLDLNDSLSYGYFNVFGRIQLPDSLQVNQQKTDFINQLMLQKLYSRLKMLHEILLKNINSDKQSEKPNVVKEGPKLRSRVVQPPEPRQIPVKKVKRSHDDDSYHAN